MRDTDPTKSNPDKMNLSYDIRDDIAANLQVVYQSDLQPYDTQDVIYSNLHMPNRLLRRSPELRDKIHSALAAHDDESLVQLTHDIVSSKKLHASRLEKPINTIFSYMSLVAEITNTAKSLGRDALLRAPVLFEDLKREFVNSTPDDQLLNATISATFLQDRLLKLHHAIKDTPDYQDDFM